MHGRAFLYAIWHCKTKALDPELHNSAVLFRGFHTVGYHFACRQYYQPNDHKSLRHWLIISNYIKLLFILSSHLFLRALMIKAQKIWSSNRKHLYFYDSFIFIVFYNVPRNERRRVNLGYFNNTNIIIIIIIIYCQF